MSLILNQKKVVDGDNNGNRAGCRAPAKSPTGKLLDKVQKLDRLAQGKNPTSPALIPGAGRVVADDAITITLPTADGGARAYCLNALNEIVALEKRVAGQVPIQLAAE
jgi:hypothetical protein